MEFKRCLYLNSWYYLKNVMILYLAYHPHNVTFDIEYNVLKSYNALEENIAIHSSDENENDDIENLFEDGGIQDVPIIGDVLEGGNLILGGEAST